MRVELKYFAYSSRNLILMLFAGVLIGGLSSLLAPASGMVFGAFLAFACWIYSFRRLLHLSVFLRVLITTLAAFTITVLIYGFECALYHGEMMLIACKPSIVRLFILSNIYLFIFPWIHYRSKHKWLWLILLGVAGACLRGFLASKTSGIPFFIASAVFFFAVFEFFLNWIETSGRKNKIFW